MNARYNQVFQEQLVIRSRPSFGSDPPHEADVVRRADEVARLQVEYEFGAGTTRATHDVQQNNKQAKTSENRVLETVEEDSTEAVENVRGAIDKGDSDNTLAQARLHEPAPVAEAERQEGDGHQDDVKDQSLLGDNDTKDVFLGAED